VVDDYSISDGIDTYTYDYEYEDVLIGDGGYPYYNRKTTVIGPDEYGDGWGDRRKIVNTYFSFPNIKREDFKSGLLLDSKTYQYYDGQPGDGTLLKGETYFYDSMVDSADIRYAACDTTGAVCSDQIPCCYQDTPIVFAGSAIERWYYWPIKQGVKTEMYELEDYGSDGERDKLVTFDFIGIYHL
jgi:hypothetical protein